MSLLILSASAVSQVASTFSADDLRSLMADVFAVVSSSSDPAYAPPRIGIPTERHQVLFMPARISGIGTALKIVSIPREGGGGLPASTLVLDKESGTVKAVINARELTALRNAAGSLLSTTLVGITEPRVLVAFGAGTQVEKHIELHVKALPTIKHCVIVNRAMNSRLQGLMTRLATTCPGVELEAASQDRVKDLLASADIIVTATPALEPLFPSSWVRSGTHVVLIGSYKKEMHEVDRALIERAFKGILLVDSREACFAEAGELEEGDPVVEIGEIRQWRRGDYVEDFGGPVTMFKSVGVGLQDVAIACAVVERAESLGVGLVVEGYD
ncbi:NAD(P)-binding protein [Guyanagaster necrorhizus]|uniref:NAD(P)-binding protein n=1 Tax=Guyanagaster necrorhizus TaxID=856835 RepID=A0A9P8ASU0_9AGAR|nr:NAD(P)-binding protein [Guyanagaster necrorhizus MCA 3950]KAG7446271.1 NAD(P)-binding protein [Guyanagaster necrorhizus MCA 3950]